MSRTPVSEFNARMGLDISPLEQAVPRATALLRKLSSVQAEAFAAQSGGPDMQAMTERMRAVSKSPQRLGMPAGTGTATFKDAQSAQAFTDPIGAANEASLKRTALRQQEMQRAQKAASDAYLADVRMIDAALEQTAARQMQRAQERQDYEESIAQRRRASAQAINEFETQRSNLIRNSARESAAAFQADFRATDERIAAEQEIAAIRRRQAQVQTAFRFDQANPFQQQILSVQELNRLLVVRRGLQRGTVEFAQAELAVTQQIARVRGIRDSLTVGAEGMRRLGNTAADSQKGFARFGLGMQQVGYQVQDFAVQIQGGTNALTALSQQGSQLLGFFGGFYGAVAGAALSVGILGYKLYEQASGTEEAKLRFNDLNDALKENIRLTREKILLTDPSAKIGFLKEDASKSKEALAKAKAEQEKRRLAVEAANQAMLSPTSTGDIDQDAARAAAQFLRILLENMGLRKATLVTENALVEANSTELEVAKEVVATSNELFFAKAEVLAATEKQLQADYMAFAQARKQNAMDEMNNEQKLDYYLDRMKFLKEIGAKETEEYELAKRRSKELGTILLSDSGPKVVKDMSALYEKTVQSLQASLKDSFSTQGSVLSSGLMVGAASPNQLIDISRQMLKALQNLVSLETTGVKGYPV